MIYSISFANTRISSAGAIHVTKSELKQVTCYIQCCRKSYLENIVLTDNLNVTVCHLSWICSKKLIHKWRGSGHSCKITEQNLLQIVPHFAASISGVFADESGNHIEIAQHAVYLIHNGLLSWPFVLALLAIELYTHE